jgi:hypothetical protein
MKFAAACSACILAIFALTHLAIAQNLDQLRDNPLAADLTYFVPASPSGDMYRRVDNRNIRTTSTRGRDRTQFTLRYRVAGSSFDTRRAYLGARLTRYSYLPHYSRRTTIGLTTQSKPALAPLPVTSSPYGDPFYEERMLEKILGDGSGFYP